MKGKPVVVFDTNIFLSAIIFGGNPRTCLELARSGEIILYTSRSILFELVEKLREKFLWEEDELQNIIEGIVIFAKLVSPGQKITLIKEDPSDNRILECALECKADYIISGDKKHLLSLAIFKGIPILSATEILKIFYGKKP